MLEGHFTVVKNRTVETEITRNMVVSKRTNGAVVSMVSKILDQNLIPLSTKFPEFIPAESLTNVHPLVQNMFTEKIMSLAHAHFSKDWEKLTQDQKMLSTVKGYLILFFKVPVQRLFQNRWQCPKHMDN